MFIAFLSVILFLAAVAVFVFGPKISEVFEIGLARFGAGALLLVFSFVAMGSLSWVTIDENSVGHLNRIMAAPDLPAGKIIAANGEKGPQAEILGPGLHIRPFINVLYDVDDETAVVEVPEGKVGFITAKDGLPMPEGSFMAPAWPEDKVSDMLRAEYFLNEGRGIKGPQLTVLRPARYRLNKYLFDVTLYDVWDIPTGHVAVVRSNVAEHTGCPTQSTNDVSNAAALLVPRGCVGVWNTALPPGRYYMNPKAYVGTMIPTRAQTLVYKGGYTKRQIDLSVEEDGKIIQKEAPGVEKVVPKGAAGPAITVRVEGWTVPVELRTIMQITPENAPLAVASVGELEAIEKIVTAGVRDGLRTIGGDKDRKVKDFIDGRSVLSSALRDFVAGNVAKYGISIVDTPMGEPAIPPELLVASLREQLATQLKATYEQEKLAQTERIKVEQERATANQQHILVKAEINKEASKFKAIQLKLEGQGERDRLIEIAKGQQAQVEVLGAERTMQLQMLKETLAIAKEQPEIIKVPAVQVIGGSAGSLEGAAAVLGSSSNFSRMLSNTMNAPTNAK